VQPRVVSISQVTEYGTVYSGDEVRAITDFAHARDLFVHMDGARLANAAASLEVPLRDAASALGIDVLSFGGTKNGAIAAEAVAYFDKRLAKDFGFRRMQAMQLASKMRFVAAQFDALLTDDLWLRSAKHSNGMAALLGRELSRTGGVRLTQRVDANEVFAILPREKIARIQEKMLFEVWDDRISEVRFVTSFDTTEEDVMTFAAHVRNCMDE
jgi:threonine aldolase